VVIQYIIAVVNITTRAAEDVGPYCLLN